MRKVVSASLLLRQSAACASLRCSSTKAPPADQSPQSSSSPLVVVSDSGLCGVKVVSLNNMPVNVLSTELLSTLIRTLEKIAEAATASDRHDKLSKKQVLQDDDEEPIPRGVILTSQLPLSEGVPVFSSGLDLQQLVRDGGQSTPDKAAFVHYWTQFQRLFVLMHQYPLPLVAAINGHAPAAGCILGMCCDYRVMARSGVRKHASGEAPTPTALHIGIAASRAGFAVPPFVAANLAFCVGPRRAEEMLQKGLLLTADEALQCGLVDEVVDDGEQTLVSAAAEIDLHLSMPYEHTKWLVKDATRRSLVGMLGSPKKRHDDCASFYDMITHPDVRVKLGEYHAKLSKTAKK